MARNTPKPQVEAKAPAAQEEKQEQAPAPKAPPRPSGIQVVARRKGFYNQDRKKEGDKFLIKKVSDFGSWMRCVDPSAEQECQKYLKSKRAGR